MIRLRILGIASNICFVGWAFFFGIYPVLVLHLCLLPVNGYRLFQIQRIKRRAAQSSGAGASPLEWLRPLAKSVTYDDGAYVFRIGDAPDRLYYIVSGSVIFEELGKWSGPGELFGEVAFLTSRRERTASARCEGRTEIFALDAGDLATLSLQHPAFNAYVLRVIAERLTGGEVPMEVGPLPFGDIARQGAPRPS